MARNIAAASNNAPIDDPAKTLVFIGFPSGGQAAARSLQSYVSPALFSTGQWSRSFNGTSLRNASAAVNVNVSVRSFPIFCTKSWQLQQPRSAILRQCGETGLPAEPRVHVQNTSAEMSRCLCTSVVGGLLSESRRQRRSASDRVRSNIFGTANAKKRVG